MLIKTFHNVKNRFPAIGFFITRIWYWYVSKADKEDKVTLMNYGYTDDNGIEASVQEDWNRYPVQLYHFVGSKVSLQNKKVLEVGSGRGGGAQYLARTFKPASMAGVDICKKAVEFCSKKYTDQNSLNFKWGDALQLQNNFKPGSFDVVINIESSHRYQDFYAFLEGVFTILTPGGYFLLADFRKNHEWEQVKKDIQKANFKIIESSDITPNVVKALDLDSERREALIKKLTPKILHKTAKEFAGTPNTSLYDSFASGNCTYHNLVLQKPEG